MTGSKRLTPPQSRKVNSLVKKECCNCERGHCILLDDGEECVCPQLISYSLLCKWFQIAVLPLDKLLHAELFKTEEVIENNNLVISVSDDGCGFKNIEIEKATLPFYKSSKDISTEHLGLGLNISKILSERHGGNIQITNNKAGGACVTVKINCNES